MNKLLLVLFTITFSLQAQDINAKLGGTTANETYDVTDSGDNLLFRVQGDGGALFFGTYNTGTIPATGAGTRMMWYPKKAAFRVGYTEGDVWDDSNIGINSMAMGWNTKASGNFSTAMGNDNVASGTTATCIGTSSEASGNYSTAIGGKAKAQSQYSVAVGSNNIGGGNPTSWVDTDPIFEIGIGSYTVSKNALTVLKNGNIGIGTTTPTARLQVNGDDGLLVIGGSISNGVTQNLGMGPRMHFYSKKRAFRAGYVNGTQWDDANMGDYSTAMGYGTTASGNYSTAMGREIQAPGDYSVAIALNDQNSTKVTQANTMAIMGGKVGIGTTNPKVKLDVTDIVRVGGNSWPGVGKGMELAYNTTLNKGFIQVYDRDASTWGVLYLGSGRVGIGTETPGGSLDVNGSIYQRGISLHADYVFDEDYELESIQEHTDFMWTNKHLPAIPKAKVDENGNEIVEVGSHRQGIVEELEKAHIYIAQLEERITKLENK